MKKKQDLKSLTRNELIDWFEKHGFKGFRAKQVFNWIYKNGINDYQEMSNLPEALIDKLEQISYIYNLFKLKKLRANDGTIKYLWNLNDNETIESVYLPYYTGGRHSVCISSQIGCAMGCQFCATGLNGLIRNLTPGEIVDQVLKVQADISQTEYGIPPITNVVFMGMGEPLANFNSVLKAINIFNDGKGLNIGIRKMTISTAGLIPGIDKLAREDIQVGLAISLNAPNDRLRNRIMPINKKYPLTKLLQSVKSYIKRTGRRVTFEYVLLKNINDSPELAYQLADLLADLLCHVNLIPVNPVSEFDFERPDRNDINKFKSILDRRGIQTTIRQEKGKGINAACGQLRRKNSSGGD